MKRGEKKKWKQRRQGKQSGGGERLPSLEARAVVGWGEGWGWRPVEFEEQVGAASVVDVPRRARRAGRSRRAPELGGAPSTCGGLRYEIWRNLVGGVAPRHRAARASRRGIQRWRWIDRGRRGGVAGTGGCGLCTETERDTNVPAAPVLGRWSVVSSAGAGGGTTGRRGRRDRFPMTGLFGGASVALDLVRHVRD